MPPLTDDAVTASPQVSLAKPLSLARPALQDIYLSCIIPAYNEADNLPIFIPALSEFLQQYLNRFELIVIDDGSADDTLTRIKPLLERYPLTILALSRNFGKEAALAAGLKHAGGEAVLLIDSDFQHPFNAIPDMLALWQRGYDMIYGIRNRSSETFLKRLYTRIYYWLLNHASEVPMPSDAGDFRLLDRVVVDALLNLPERTLYMKGLYAWVGFKSIGLHFEEQARQAGTSHFNFTKLFMLSLTAFTAFSDTPLRLAVVSGIIIALSSLAYGLYIMVHTLIWGKDLPGWTTLVVGMMFLGGIQLLFIGVLGEYIGRIYNEVKGRPRYIIAEHMQSPLVAVSSLKSPNNTNNEV